ncbi:hypothetical protein CCDG5_0289 [[Clostridium] cellulosi]|uniref:DUF3502 domain-containing protein n=1 Tax=[Clostridium] cellulosi TaxID=29343 RepID=A0A078KLT1_9FIRM|nr:hypothetical protein CCDG5_0289 [[Clostridium] cellulosi]
MHSGKKLLCLTLALTTALPFMLTGCKKNDNSSSTGGNKSKPTVTLKMFTGDAKSQGQERVVKAINKYLEEKGTGIQIDWQQQAWDPLGQKINTMLQTGQQADIVFVSNWNGAGYRSHAANGYLTDLTPYLEKNPDLVELLGKDFLDSSKINGKNYAMPTNKEKAHDWGFLIKKDLIDKYGIDITKIKKLEDMEPYFEKAKADGIIPICAAAMDNPFKFLDWDVIVGDGTPGAFDPAEGCNKVFDQFTDDKSVAFYKKMKEYNKKGYFSPNASTAESQETEMKSGKYLCGSWSLVPGKDKSESISLGFDVVQVDITPIEKTNRETTGAMLAIPTSSQHKDEAFQLIKMLYTDKTLVNLFVWGEEGIDYEKKSDNIIELKSSSDYKSAGGWILGNQFINYLTTTQDPNLWKSYEEYNDKATALPSLGFIFDPTPVKDQVNSCSNTVTAYYKQLFYGTCDVDKTVSAFKKELKANGVDELLSEMQKQYDAWKSSK